MRGIGNLSRSGRPAAKRARVIKDGSIVRPKDARFIADSLVERATRYSLPTPFLVEKTLPHICILYCGSTFGSERLPRAPRWAKSAPLPYERCRRRLKRFGHAVSMMFNYASCATKTESRYCMIAFLSSMARARDRNELTSETRRRRRSE